MPLVLKNPLNTAHGFDERFLTLIACYVGIWVGLLKGFLQVKSQLVAFPFFHFAK